MVSHPLMQRLDSALNTLRGDAALPFLAWLIDRHGLRLADRIGCAWAVHDVMDAIHQRSLGQTPSIGSYVKQWEVHLKNVQLDPLQLKLLTVCAYALSDLVKSAALTVAEAYKLSGLNAEPVIGEMLEKLR